MTAGLSNLFLKQFCRFCSFFLIAFVTYSTNLVPDMIIAFVDLKKYIFLSSPKITKVLNLSIKLFVDNWWRQNQNHRIGLSIDITKGEINYRWKSKQDKQNSSVKYQNVWFNIYRIEINVIVRMRCFALSAKSVTVYHKSSRNCQHQLQTHKMPRNGVTMSTHLINYKLLSSSAS